MSGKRKKSSASKRRTANAARPGPGPAPPPSQSTFIAIIAAVIIVALAVALAAWLLAPETSLKLAPVLPNNRDRLDPLVLEQLDRQIERVRTNPGSAEAHGALGLAYEANNMWQEARDAYDNAVRLDPDDPLWRYHLAVVSLSAGEFDRSQALLERVVKEKPDFPAALHRLGLILMQQDELDRAEQVCERARRLMPDQPAAHVGLASVYIRQQKYAEAMPLLKEALALDPNFKTAHYQLGLAYRGLGRRDAAAEELRLGANAIPIYLPDPLTPRMQQFTVGISRIVGQAADLIEGGKPAQAVALLEQAQLTREEDVNILNNLGAAYFGMGNVDKALKVWHQAERIDPEQFAIHVNLARCYLNQKKPELALHHADRAVATGPTIGQAHYWRGAVLAVLQRYAEGLESLQSAVRLDAQNPQIYIALGETCAILNRDEEARDHFQTAARLLPSHLPVHVNLAQMCLRLDDIQGARRALAGAQRIQADHPRVRQLRQLIDERTRQ